MIRINRETDYATAILGVMAAEPDERFSASGLAARRGLPGPVVSKILKQLVRGGLLRSHRGAKGGYSLARDAGAISIAEVIMAMEGPIALTDCIEGGGEACQFHAHCVLSTNWSRINDAIYRALQDVSIKDMIEPLTDDHPGLRNLGRHVRDSLGGSAGQAKAFRFDHG
ncbi:SUF system Fe-S cluster assembly regulator [Methylonatrum kenyense]|uniref:SUF system Fe-S cluster assembly regulator n=1 Tax=Methylonatrum kenyense TaxID=455253 RepID=UPI0020BE9CA4|nr:SUF system Fe-S cluster assembly regulator [Methylonatrum kenyense]MCK8514902.1 SUF system Fe-S cluster assembly regulator [Methylonatrum kenyense]